MSNRSVGKHLLRLAAGLAALGLAASQGQTIREPVTAVLGEAIWLAPSAPFSELLTTRPPEHLRSVAAGGKPSFLVSLGKLAFRSPLILGERASRLGLSCNTCHPNGGANTAFFVAGLSDRPGNVDATHAFWHSRADDRLFNPVNIPTLRGVRHTAPYGRDGRFASLRHFTRHVIVTEFGGDQPEPLLLDALVAYQLELDPLPNAMIGPSGRLTAEAPSVAQRGAPLFARDCASCHVPTAGFVDGRRHDVETGGRLDTPSLLGLAESAPYLRDGRAADLAAAVDHFSAVLGLQYSKDEHAAMIGYLEAIGGVDRARERITVEKVIRTVRSFAALLVDPLQSEDAALGDLIADMLRFELGHLHARFRAPAHAEARGLIVSWALELRRIGSLAEDGAFPAARAALSVWQTAIIEQWPALKAVADTSLFNPETIPAGG